MSGAVIDNPILNSPFAEPSRHWDLDENGIPVLETVYRDLVFFVRKQDITETDARTAFNTFTSNAHPTAVQSLYEPTEEQWNEDWSNGIGTFFDVG